VSTDKDDQLNSLENQRIFFEQYITKNPQWKFIGIYADEGITGTSTKKRKQFNAMIDDGEDKKFDMIITKEVSRFARNTVDVLRYTRKLKDNGIGVLFLYDNINTLDNDGELRLSIMASIAQEESRKTSERVKFGQQQSMKRGVVFGSGVYGYDIIDKKLYVNEEQAKVIQLIFELYLNEGMGSHRIGIELENRGILSPSGNPKWKNASVLKMIKNEKYVGDLLQKKAITPNYLEHYRKINEGEEEMVLIENNHEPIIDRELFDKVQKEIIRRRTLRDFEKGIYANRYVWSGRIKCGYCNSTLKRRICHPYKNPYIVWDCGEKMINGKALQIENNQVKRGCPNKAVHETLIKECLLKGLDFLSKNKEKCKIELKKIIEDVIYNSNDNSDEIYLVNQEINKINNNELKLLELFTEDKISRTSYDKAYENYSKQLKILNDKLILLQSQNEEIEDLTGKIHTIESVIDGILDFEVFSEEVCKIILDKVVIKSEENISFFLTRNRFENNLFFLFPIMQYRRRKARLKSQCGKRRSCFTEAIACASDSAESARFWRKCSAELARTFRLRRGNRTIFRGFNRMVTRRFTSESWRIKSGSLMLFSTPCRKLCWISSCCLS